MSDILASIGAATSGMEAQATRLRMISENIANTDTPGFRRKTISFEEVRRQDDPRAVATGRIYFDQKELEEIYEPAHPLADARGFYQGSNVDMLVEIADAREARRSYEANLRMFEQSREMLTGLMGLLNR